MINNSKPRNPNIEVDTIIIHSMGQYIGGIHAFDFLENIGLSAHFLIEDDGNTFYGPNHNRVAYHAGVSEWKGDTNLNKNSIGIELLIAGDHNYSSFIKAIRDTHSFSESHYETLAKLCKDLMNIYPKITLDKILTHSDVSGDRVRGEGKGKVDPGSGFSMLELKLRIRSIL